jgi:hypothetical protein
MHQLHEHTAVYRRHEKQTLEALSLLAEQLEHSGDFDLAMDCQESMTALRNGNLAVASSLLVRVSGWTNEEQSSTAQPGSFARDLAISHLAGLQEHLLGAAQIEDWG